MTKIETPPHWGAWPFDWDVLHLVAGVTADLLPVVSNPHAEIAPYSAIAELGKTPSRFDDTRHVCGIPKWTQKTTRAAALERWAAEPDYGICIQTREVRAIDADIGDATIAAEVEAFIEKRLGRKLPRRGRSNSAKFLLTFMMAGDFRKRRIQIGKDNVVEFLANGQQFVACGTHPSGCRYTWNSGTPEHFPPLQSAEFDALWTALADRFGNAGTDPTAPQRDSAGKPPGRHALTVDDLTEMLIFVSAADRQQWLQVLWALRSAWRESSTGLEENTVLELADAWSQRSDNGRYKDVADVTARFRQGDDKKNRGVSWRTLPWLAWRGGWRSTLLQRERMEGDLADDLNNIGIGALYGIL